MVTSCTRTFITYTIVSINLKVICTVIVVNICTIIITYTYVVGNDIVVKLIPCIRTYTCVINVEVV